MVLFLALFPWYLRVQTPTTNGYMMVQHRTIPMGPEKSSVGHEKIRAKEILEGIGFHTPESEDLPILFPIQRYVRLFYIDQRH